MKILGREHKKCSPIPNGFFWCSSPAALGRANKSMTGIGLKRSQRSCAGDNPRNGETLSKHDKYLAFEKTRITPSAGDPHRAKYFY
jgi:hypothetical protein